MQSEWSEGLYLDSRVYNLPRWYLERPKDWWMFLPSEYLRSVLFLEQDRGSGPQPVGTAFFVSVPAEGVDGLHVYLVTASHCVWDWARDEPRTDLYMRVDAGPPVGMRHIRLPDGDGWFFHPNPVPRVDVAVMPIGGNAGNILMTQLGCRWVPRAMFFSEDALSDNPNMGVGLSDEVLALGLFANHAGKDRNEPVVRTGNIAMIPHEPVATNPTFGPMEIYLVELRSIAGMSGSPVFAPHRILIGQPTRPVSLLGVLLGHYDMDPGDMATAAVNMGIGMVAPAKMLHDILDQEALVKRRDESNRRAREVAKEKGFQPDSLPVNEISREEFLTDLRKAARRQEPPSRADREKR